MHSQNRRQRYGGSSGNAVAPSQTMVMIDAAVMKAHSDLLAGGESISAWKVSQSALMILKAYSFESLGFQLQNVSSLYRLMIIEAKVNSFINCFVGVQKITSVHDLDMAICESEGIKSFEELELGPLLKHPLVVHYFCTGCVVTEICKITSEEIAAYLSILLRKCRKVTVDELLDYIAKRKKQSRENLCVRIQSLGMHIGHIMRGRRSEITLLKKCSDGLDVKSILGDNQDDAGKATKDEDNWKYDDDIDDSGIFSSENATTSDPSQVPRIWLDTEMDCSLTSSHHNKRCNDSVDLSEGMRVSENKFCMKYAIHKTPQKWMVGIKFKPEFQSPDVETWFIDDNAVDGHTWKFINIWKDTCEKENNVVKVFDKMLDFYRGQMKPKRKIKAINIVIESSLHVGLLNVAIASIKCGLWDRMSSAPEANNKGVGADTISKTHDVDEHTWRFIKKWKDTCEKEENVVEAFGKMLDYNGQMKPKTKNKALNKMITSYPHVGLVNVAIASIKFGLWDHMSSTPRAKSKEVIANTEFKACAVDKRDIPGASKHVLDGRADIALEDVLKYFKGYSLNFDHVLDNITSYQKKQLMCLREIHKLECSLTQHFFVDDFETLGFGDIFTFLVEHNSLLPTTWQNCFKITDKTEKPSIKVCMSQCYLLEFLLEAANSLGEHETLSNLMVSELLRMQFPCAGLTLLEDDFTSDLLTTLRKNGDNVSSNIVLFSSTLSSFRAEKGLSDTQVGTKDAVQLLLKAPMLVDLTSWSYWDYKFAPSLGPLVGWLLSNVTTKELLCLVTRDGKILRLDLSSTVDSFLEAFIQGSSFETALKLVSLIGLYGGELNLPLSLLKCHAKNGFEIMLKISSKTIASKFVFDCLGYIPKEFRSFATELLVSAFRSIVKDAHMVILSECKSKEDHMMIHELGLSLGIIEWFDDNCSCLSESKESLENKRFISKNEFISSLEVNQPTEDCKRDSVITHSSDDSYIPFSERDHNAARIIESIRIEEFGLDPNITITESRILKKQHARLGRALHCLSQELYSKDSHFLLELVQNADDNMYPSNVEPTLTFIIQEKSIVVLNNERGFSAKNIRALCDVGNSTKKESTAGYIGKKGIGFKSVFRVTDAPEIHSNGFHIKFDLTDGQIGFVLPTIVPPCDINLFTNLVSFDTTDQVNTHHYNTCIVLPLKSKLTESSTVGNITSMFLDLHPSLLLFLHRLQCIKFRNMLTDSSVIMRKEITGNGLTNVTIGNETLNWFVESRELKVNGIRDDVKTTEISVAFGLEVLQDSTFIPKLDQQYVFAFLPLRTYGLKFIIQGDFILPSSREEVDGDSAWNQWLLSELPNLFVNSERSFCCLPGFNNCLGKGVSAFLSYVPLVGEVHGFFASLPRMIISKLCTTNCLLLEGENEKWVPPCRVLRNWNKQTRNFLHDSLIQKHLGLGYLKKEIVLSDSLARALGIQNYGPKILVQLLSSLCRTKEGLTSLGFIWLSSWLNELYSMSLHDTSDFGIGSDIMNTLRKLPFIPLLDGCYGSIEEDIIWMNLGGSWSNIEAFTRLLANLRIVNPALFDCSISGNLTQMLSKIGVQQLSAHQVVKAHVLPAICDKKNIINIDLMTEYLWFTMVHLQSKCSDCCNERKHIISEVYHKALILTNHGFVTPSEVAIHFSNDFGNRINISRLISGIDVKWYEVDKTYLKYTAGGSMVNWRKFLHELEITDFVQTVCVEKTVSITSHFVLTNMNWEKEIVPSGATIIDWESRELVDLLEKVSLSGDRERCKYLLEVIDEMWADYFSNKDLAFCNIDGESKPFKSSIVSALNDVKWVVSSVADGLYYPKDLFHNSEAVCSILGDNAPYAVPMIRNEKLVTSIGFKITVTLHDALSVLQVWKRSTTSFRASISQMSRFYSFIWNEMACSDKKSMANLSSGEFIFIPFILASSSEVVSGALLSPQEVYWHDTMIHPECELSKMLSNLYPSLHDFFVNDCGVKEKPPLLDYLAFLCHLSTVDTPLKSAKKVFDVFVMWGDGIKSGLMGSEDIEMLKRNLQQKETNVFPTAQDKWVSLHSSFGLVCWCDDEKLADEFEELNIIDFFRLCELTDEEKEMLQVKVSHLMKNLGIPALSEVITREAIYYGPVDNSYETSLVSWVLPYAQRYISSKYRERYLQLKLFGFKELDRLQIIVVEKLYYKNVIRRSKLASKKRHDSLCLLQDETLYSTRDSDSHSIFMELSRFLINGDPDLNMANFLHMITTMTKSGSTEEQIEAFVLNSQKVPKLPDDEPLWSIQPLEPMPLSVKTPSATRITKKTVKPRSSFHSNRNWPPASWQTAPKFNSSCVNDTIMQDAVKQIDLNDQVENLKHSKKVDQDGITSTDKRVNIKPGSVDQDGGTSTANPVNVEPASVDQDGPPEFSQKVQLSHGTVNMQHAFLTGRQGEQVAFNYFSKNFGKKFVKWVNEAKETGLPYDIEVFDDDNKKEYIEVKTTDSGKKDWFEISFREWQFAVEEGESFSIARVVLSGDKTGRVTIFKNPAKLCRLGDLKLAVLMSKQSKDEFVLC